MANHTLQQLNLLQDAVSCAEATLFAIEGAGLFRTLPEDADAKALHNHGCFLLSMLTDHLAAIQRQVDAMEAATAAARAEG